MLDGLLQQNKDLQEGSNDKWLDPEDSEDEFDNGDIPISHETNGKGSRVPQSLDSWPLLDPCHGTLQCRARVPHRHSGTLRLKLLL